MSCYLQVMVDNPDFTPSQVGGLFTFLARQLAKPDNTLFVNRKLFDQVRHVTIRLGGRDGLPVFRSFSNNWPFVGKYISDLATGENKKKLMIPVCRAFMPSQLVTAIFLKIYNFLMLSMLNRPCMCM